MANPETQKIFEALLWRAAALGLESWRPRAAARRTTQPLDRAHRLADRRND
jgi:hypothetical protein